MRGEKDGQIRGIFRMDPRFDPSVKAIPDKKAAANNKGAKFKDSHCSRSMKRLTSREEARSIISSKKA